MDAMGAADRFGSGFGQAKKTDLACAHEFSHCADGLLNGRVRINPMLIVEIDALNIEPAQTSFAGLAQTIGAARPSLRCFITEGNEGNEGYSRVINSRGKTSFTSLSFVQTLLEIDHICPIQIRGATSSQRCRIV